MMNSWTCLSDRGYIKCPHCGYLLSAIRQAVAMHLRKHFKDGEITKAKEKEIYFSLFRYKNRVIV